MSRVIRYMRAASLLLFVLLLLPGGRAEAAARLYDTPQAAVAALASATAAGNLAELHAILGPGAKSIVESGDATADAADRAAFTAAYEKKNTLTPDGGKDRYVLEVGPHGWPFPAPLVRDKSGRWRFDGRAGAGVLLDRRIGHNELSAIQTCLAFVDAQREYWRLNPDKAASPHYAAFIASSPGKRDGLYWQSGPGEPQSPLGELVAAAEVKGYAAPKQGEGTPYFGYRYRILDGQGKNAPSGALSYTQDGRMARGFALLAWPDRYGVSGVMTFMVNQDGAVYEKNFGRDTAAKVVKIKQFDPGGTWRWALR